MIKVVATPPWTTDHLNEHLALAAVSDKYDPAIRVAVVMGKKTLNWYYDRMDHSKLYQIAIGMFIHYKCFGKAALIQSYLSFSFTPLSQAFLFSACWLEPRLDRNSEKDCS